MMGDNVTWGGEVIGTFDDMLKEQLKNEEFKKHYEKNKSAERLAEENKMSDNVNKPNHYTYGKLECIDVIREVTNGNDAIGIEAFCLGNTIKYLWRYKHKNGIEDLKKARWYLDKLIMENEINDSGKEY